MSLSSYLQELGVEAPHLGPVRERRKAPRIARRGELVFRFQHRVGVETWIDVLQTPESCDQERGPIISITASASWPTTRVERNRRRSLPVDAP